MSTLKVFLILVCLSFLIGLSVSADNSGRIYGKILTVDGDTFEGLIRWDKNEGSWVDVLDGTKERPRSKSKSSRRKKYRDKDRSIEIFGISLSRTTVSWDLNSQSGIRFGHIKSMEVIGDDEVLLTLKSGEEVELSGGSTDIGDGIREIVIEDIDEGEIELVWDDIETIEFMQGSSNLESNFGDRIYGTLTTRRGEEFTGHICWDIDEIMSIDILDGDYKGRRRKIKFKKIASIERYSSSGAKVVLKNGDEMILRGTNDVDDSNSGIIVSDVAFGQIRVDWDEFDNVVFSEPARQEQYKKFDGGKPIYGTVYTEDGEEYTGQIRWDDDEEFTWELLNGNNHDVEFNIEFGKIKEIEKKSYRSSIVTVSDGRTFRLRGSNDVDEDNKGIFIIDDNGDEEEVEWEDFSKLVLK